MVAPQNGEPIALDWLVLFTILSFIPNSLEVPEACTSTAKNYIPHNGAMVIWCFLKLEEAVLATWVFTFAMATFYMPLPAKALE